MCSFSRQGLTTAETGCGCAANVNSRDGDVDSTCAVTVSAAAPKQTNSNPPYPSDEFEASARLRAEAEKAHAEWHAGQRISRALNSRPRPPADYSPGDLIYFWRSQESGQGRKQPGHKTGRFLGPARILAVETRQADGMLKPGSNVWCVRGRQLIKCSVEQLRHASEREELYWKNWPRTKASPVHRGPSLG